jgi:hypothetical protein
MSLNLLARLGLAVLLALPAVAQAQAGERPPPPDRNPLRPVVKTPLLPAEAPIMEWSAGEVAAAEADCAKSLAELALDYEKLPPIKEGKCGAPAPILLKAVGDQPKVEIDPPATVTCKLARALSTWLKNTVQPEAKVRFGAPVVKLTNASSYVCRNRYNGTDTALSEHALANALDVSEFVFQSGEKLTVLASWPRLAVVEPTQDQSGASAEITGSVPTAAVDASGKAADAAAAAKSNPFVPAPEDARTNPFVLPTAVAKAAPPRPPAEARPPEAPPTSEFVRKVHQDACKAFGTVLGPEANEAHKDHFHLDMKARRHKAICE